MTIVHDTADVDALDRHFIASRAHALALSRTAARGEFVRKAGVASLLAGAGLGLAFWGASFLLEPKIVERVLPGKETFHETVRDVPGPTITKEVVKEVFVTPAEKTFLESPAYAAAEIKGCIVKSIDGRALSFDSGQNFWPTDDGKGADSEPFLGEWGMCLRAIAGEDRFHCFAVHRDVVMPVPQKPAGRPT